MTVRFAFRVVLRSDVDAEDSIATVEKRTLLLYSTCMASSHPEKKKGKSRDGFLKRHLPRWQKASDKIERVGQATPRFRLGLVAGYQRRR